MRVSRRIPVAKLRAFDRIRMKNADEARSLSWHASAIGGRKRCARFLQDTVASDFALPISRRASSDQSHRFAHAVDSGYERPRRDDLQILHHLFASSRQRGQAMRVARVRRSRKRVRAGLCGGIAACDDRVAHDHGERG